MNVSKCCIKCDIRAIIEVDYGENVIMWLDIQSTVG